MTIRIGLRLRLATLFAVLWLAAPNCSGSGLPEDNPDSSPLCDRRPGAKRGGEGEGPPNPAETLGRGRCQRWR
ncbi:MAG: hypothetical protein ACRDFX_10985 [Chloroflexota bacterium]